MKKILAILTIICSLLLITGCNNKLNSYTSISYSDFVAKKDNGETFPLVIGSSTCSACANYELVMNIFIKDYQVEVFYIDLTSIKEDEYNKLKTEINFDATPTTVFYKDGKITSFYNRLVGSEDINSVIKYMKSNNYVG